MTNFEMIKAMDIEEFASFIHAIIEETNKKNDAVLAENGISFTRITLDHEIQIRRHIKYLESEAELYD